MQIRKFAAEDTGAVIQLWKDCNLVVPWNDPGKDIARKMTAGADLFLVGEIGGKIIAAAMAGYDGHRGSVYYLAVHPDHQKTGYARQLMEEIETRLKAVGCPKINIMFRTSNEQVRGFYESLGYKQDEVVCYGKRLIPDD